jgi:hypothetical protein
MLAALAIGIVLVGLAVMFAAFHALDRRTPVFEAQERERLGYRTSQGRRLPAKESARVADTTGRTTHGR